MNKKNKNSFLISTLFYMIIFSIFILPPIEIRENFPKVRLEDFLILLVFIILCYKNNIIIDHKLKIYISFLFIYSLWITLTTIINISFISHRGIYEILKILKYILIIMIGYYCYDKSINLDKLINNIFIIMAIFNFLCYFNILNFFYIVKPYFYSLNPFHYDSNIHLMELGIPIRLLGTMGNPNTNAILYSFFIIYYFIMYRNDKKLVYVIYLILSIVIFLFSNSRTLFIALIIVFEIYFIAIKRDLIMSLFSMLVIILIILLLVNFKEFYYLTSLFTRPISQNSSLLKRFEIWERLISMVGYDHFIFGFGPYKEFFYQNNLMAESEYILMYWRYGILGLILHLFLIFIPLFLVTKKRNDKYISILFMFSIIILISSLTMAPLTEPRFNALYAVLVGLSYRSLAN